MSEEADLDHDEKQQVDEYENVHSSVIFEAIRREGEHELSPPFSALWWSGVAAGLAISTSVFCRGFLASILPHADWAAGSAGSAANPARDGTPARWAWIGRARCDPGSGVAGELALTRAVSDHVAS